MSDSIKIARDGVLEHLKARFQAGDKSVKPMSEENSHRWYKPQANYFSGDGKMICAACKTGTLRYSRAASNGHVHARCSNLNCVAWME
jgi:hypothetical protein